MLTKPDISTKSRALPKILIVLLVAVWVVAASINNAESLGNMISLNPSEVNLKTIRVIKNTDVKISNDSKVKINDFTVIQIASGKKMLSIDGLEPSASFNLAFDHPGTYVACYSKESKEAFSSSTCLQIEVIGLRSA